MRPDDGDGVWGWGGGVRWGVLFCLREKRDKKTSRQKTMAPPSLAVVRAKRNQRKTTCNLQPSVVSADFRHVAYFKVRDSWRAATSRESGRTPVNLACVLACATPPVQSRFLDISGPDFFNSPPFPVCVFDARPPSFPPKQVTFFSANPHLPLAPFLTPPPLPSPSPQCLPGQ